MTLSCIVHSMESCEAQHLSYAPVLQGRSTVALIRARGCNHLQEAFILFFFGGEKWEGGTDPDPSRCVDV